MKFQQLYPNLWIPKKDQYVLINCPTEYRFNHYFAKICHDHHPTDESVVIEIIDIDFLGNKRKIIQHVQKNNLQLIIIQNE